jgi:hypothetical protein
MRRATMLWTVAAVLACQPAGEGADTTAADTPAGTTGSPDTSAASGGAMASGDVMLTLDKTTYAPGAAVVMTIMSHRADTLGYNPCSNRTVERETPSGWVAHAEPNRMCTMELRLLMPNETQTAQTDIPADATAGTYRIVLRLSPQGPGSTAGTTVTAVSAPFAVS